MTARIVTLRPDPASTRRPSFDWCSRDGYAPIGRRCRTCEQIHLCRTLLSSCRCPACDSDQMETA